MRELCIVLTSVPQLSYSLPLVAKMRSICGREGVRGVSRTFPQPGEGVFIRELKKRLNAEKLDIPVRDVADFCQEEAIERLKGRV